MKKYNVYLSTDRGKVRAVNEDSFVINQYTKDIDKACRNMKGCDMEEPLLCGVFDGMGGEQCGEIASLIAARYAAGYSTGKDTVDDLLLFCRNANREICNYAGICGQ